MGNKHKRRKRRHPQPPPPRHPPLDEILDKVTALAEEGELEEALEVLDSAPSHLQRRFEVLLLRGTLLAIMEAFVEAIESFEQALRAAPGHPLVLLSLASLYTNLGWWAHAARTARPALEASGDALPREAIQDLEEILKEATAEIRERAAQGSVPFEKMEEAIHISERANRRLITGRFEEAARLYNRASRVVPSWLPPYNNAALALFLAGQVKRAIQLSETVLEAHSENIHALANLIRFHLALGEREKAEEYGARLKRLHVDSVDDLDKVIEAFGLLDDDEALYEIYRRHRRQINDLDPYALFTLGSAAANLKHFRTAKRLWKKAKEQGYPIFFLLPYLIAADQKAPGPGGAQRYYTISFPQLVPPTRAGELSDLIDAWTEGEITERHKEKRIKDLLKRTPFLVRGLAQVIWGSMDPMPGIQGLAFIGTPEAVEELRRFAFGKAGQMKERLAALQHLVEMGVIEPEQTVQVWNEEEQQWEKVQMFPVEITSDIEGPDYAPEVIERLNAGVQALHRGELEEAQKEFLAALELDPQAAIVHHNLSVALEHMGQIDEAIEHLKRALEIRPDYLFARCSLANYYMDEGDLKAAEEVLDPLAERRRFHPAEWLYYHRTMARLRIEQKEYKQAKHHAQIVLEIDPEDETAQRILDVAQFAEFFHSPGWEAYWQRQREREERKRHRPTHPEARLAECLKRLTKDALIGTARAMPEPRRYNVRKAVLIQDLAEYLTNPRVLQEILKDLSDEERQALQDVLEAGGTMDWEQFTGRYGDDLDESPYWNYHEPETVMGRLRMLGLLSEGTVDDHLIVLIPYELRKLLPPLLEEEG